MAKKKQSLEQFLMEKVVKEVKHQIEKYPEEFLENISLEDIAQEPCEQAIYGFFRSEEGKSFLQTQVEKEINQYFADVGYEKVCDSVDRLLDAQIEKIFEESPSTKAKLEQGLFDALNDPELFKEALIAQMTGAKKARR